MTSDTNQKIRGLLLAALMVTSVFAGSIAFAGTAAAANNLSDVTFNGQTPSGPVSVDEGASASHTISFQVDNVADDGNTDTFRVEFPNAYQGSLTLEDVSVENSDDSSTIEVTGTSVVNSGDTLQFTISPDSNADTVDVTATVDVTVEQPNVQSTTDYGINAEVVDSDGPTASAEDVVVLRVQDTDSSNVDTDSVSGPYYAGQTLLFTDDNMDTGSITSGESITVYTEDEDNADEPDQLALDLEAQTDGEVLIDTDGLESDDYVVLDSDDNLVASFSLVEQRFDVEFDDSTVTDEGSDAQTELDVSSANRAGDFTANVSADGLDAGDLQNIFADYDTSTTDDDDILTVTLNKDQTETVDFTDIDRGDYTFNFSVTDTDAEASDDITVERLNKNYQFEDGSVSVARGGIAEVNISMGDASTGAVSIGSEEDGFVYNASIEDDNDDGYVNFTINTYDQTISSADDIVGDGDDYATGTIIPSTDSEDVPLAAANYDLAVGPEEFYRHDTDDSSDDVGTLAVTDRTTTGVQTWTASEDARSDISNADDVASAIENGTVTQDGTIAQGDHIIVQIQASGLDGYIEAVSTETDSSEVSDAFEGADEGVNGHLNLTIRQTNPEPNRPNKMVNNQTIDYIVDGDNGQVFAVIDTAENDQIMRENGDASEWDDNDEFDVSFDVVSASELAEGDEEVTSSFEMVTREATLDANDDDIVEVEASENASISGTSTIAAGSEIQLRVQSVSGSDNPFVATQTVNVSADGTFSGSFDFSDRAVGTNFTVTATDTSRSSFDEDVEYDGTVVEQIDDSTTTEEPDTTTEEPTTEEPTTEEPTTEEPSETTTTTDEPETTTTTSPGFGIAVALVALAGAALLALRREN
ncbi:BGTF surface domain-containing protein [Halogranum gelatinilyticum]|nr:BGTF surface domain-containing protein [Halogranum gelatinilyticum]